MSRSSQIHSSPPAARRLGLPHHLFTPEEFQRIFPRFKVMDLQVYDDRVMVLQGIRG